MVIAERIKQCLLGQGFTKEKKTKSDQAYTKSVGVDVEFLVKFGEDKRKYKGVVSRLDFEIGLRFKKVEELIHQNMYDTFIAEGWKPESISTTLYCSIYEKLFDGYSDDAALESALQRLETYSSMTFSQETLEQYKKNIINLETTPEFHSASRSHLATRALAFAYLEGRLDTFDYLSLYEKYSELADNPSIKWYLDIFWNWLQQQKEKEVRDQ